MKANLSKRFLVEFLYSQPGGRPGIPAPLAIGSALDYLSFAYTLLENLSGVL